MSYAKVVEYLNESKASEKAGNLKRAQSFHHKALNTANKLADRAQAKGANWLVHRDDIWNRANAEATGNRLMGLGGGSFVNVKGA